MPPPASTPPAPRPHRPGLGLAYAVEGGLAVLAAAIAWMANIPLREEIGFSPESLSWGLLATVPMLVALAVLNRVTWPPVTRVREIVRSFARILLLEASWLEIAVLCLLAGVGEELLFRGVIQPLIADRTSLATGIVVTGVLFGAVHFLTKTYFLLAVAVGCYFGWLYVATGSLAAPIVAHAVYDFVALVVVLRGERLQRPRGKAEERSDWRSVVGTDSQKDADDDFKME